MSIPTDEPTPVDIDEEDWTDADDLGPAPVDVEQQAEEMRGI